MALGVFVPSGAAIEQVEFVTDTHELHPGGMVYQKGDCLAVFMEQDGVVRLASFGLKEHMDDPDVVHGMGAYVGRVALCDTDGYQPDSPNTVASDDPDMHVFIRDKTGYVCGRIALANR